MSVYLLRFFSETEPTECAFVLVDREIFISRNWITQLCGLASPKYTGPACSLETLGRVHVASLRTEDSMEVGFLPPQEAAVFFLETFK